MSPGTLIRAVIRGLRSQVLSAGGDGPASADAAREEIEQCCALRAKDDRAD